MADRLWSSQNAANNAALNLCEQQNLANNAANNAVNWPIDRPVVPNLLEINIRLRLALTQARDTLERYRDPLVKELDRVLNA